MSREKKRKIILTLFLVRSTELIDLNILLYCNKLCVIKSTDTFISMHARLAYWQEPGYSFLSLSPCVPLEIPSSTRGHLEGNLRQRRGEGYCEKSVTQGTSQNLYCKRLLQPQQLLGLPVFITAYPDIIDSRAHSFVGIIFTVPAKIMGTGGRRVLSKPFYYLTSDVKDLH